MRNVKWIAAASVLAMLSGIAPVAASGYPEKPIEMIIPFGPGSNADTSGRIFLKSLRKALDAEIIPLNVPGAGGTVGMSKAAGAKPDGYTIGYSAIAPVTVQPHVRKLPYGKDSFEPICLVVDIPTAVTVAPDSPYKTMDELIAAAKTGKIVSAGPAPGSIPHIGQSAIANAYGVKFTYLPVGGGAKQAKAILGGEAHLSTDTAAMEGVYGLRTLAVLSNSRFPSLPNVPTLKELGKDLALTIWFGVFGPKGTPAPILDTLSDACGKAMADPEFKAAMKNANYVVRHMARDAFTDFYRKQFEDNKALLNMIGAKTR